MLKKNYIKVSATGKNGQRTFALTEKGTKLTTLLNNWKQEYQTLQNKQKTSDPMQILQTLKRSKHPTLPSLFLIANILIDKQ
jgi:DNA-binding PadR family transcriptional regulator